MNLSDLRRAAEHSDSVQGNARTRLGEVHLRIRARRRRRAVAVAVATALAVGLGSVVVLQAREPSSLGGPAGSSVSSAGFDPDASSWCGAAATPPPEGRVGYLGLPPQGAAPSSTTRAPMVLYWFGPDPLGWGKSHVWLFADGRLIVEREAALAEGATDTLSGYLERCLSPTGVASMRRYVMENAQPPSGEMYGWLFARATNDGPLLTFSYTSVAGARLLEPTSWLRDSDWVDRRYRPYVPTAYSFCRPVPETGKTASPVLDGLPRGVADVVRRRPWTKDGCTTLTLDETRGIVAIFDATWFAPDYDGAPAVLIVELSTRLTTKLTDPGAAALHVSIEPVLPDGRFTCSGCG